jgi:acyl carrier protein
MDHDFDTAVRQLEEALNRFLTGPFSEARLSLVEPREDYSRSAAFTQSLPTMLFSTFTGPSGALGDICHSVRSLGDHCCTMDELQIYARLAEIFQDVFDEDLITVTPELSAKDIENWDSLTHIRLMLTVEKAFKIKFSVSEIGKLKNVGDLVVLIKART